MLSSRMYQSSSRHCCVPFCTSDGRYDHTLRFHRIPKDESLRKQWILKIRRDEGQLFRISNSTFVCSKHFTKDDFSSWAPVKQNLKKGTVPSVFDWSGNKTTQPAHSRKILSSRVEQTADSSDVTLEMEVTDEPTLKVKNKERRQRKSTQPRRLEDRDDKDDTTTDDHSEEPTSLIMEAENIKTEEDYDDITDEFEDKESDEDEEDDDENLDESKDDDYVPSDTEETNEKTLLPRKRKRNRRAPKPEFQATEYEVPEPDLIQQEDGKEIMQFSCPNCFGTFVSKPGFVTHLKSCLGPNTIIRVKKASDIGPFTCEICERTYKLYSSFMRHMMCHKDSELNKCQICERQFGDPKSLQGHILIHTGEKPYQCEVCRMCFRDRSTLRKHFRRHGKPEDKKFQCDHCDKSFFQRTDLKKHAKIHEKDMEFKCDQCFKQFYLKAAFTSHMLRHQGVKSDYCPECDKYFCDLSSYKAHVRIHTGDRPYSCEICGKRFTFRGALHRHKKTHQSRNGQYTCLFCFAKFESLENLELHKQTHGDISPYMCTVCCQKFDNSIELKKHRQIHKESKSYQCQFCFKYFTRNESRLRHIRTLHKDMTFAEGYTTAKGSQEFAANDETDMKDNEDNYRGDNHDDGDDDNNYDIDNEENDVNDIDTTSNDGKTKVSVYSGKNGETGDAKVKSTKSDNRYIHALETHSTDKTLAMESASIKAISDLL